MQPLIQLVWWELFELNWFHLTCNHKYTKTIMVLISKACTVWCWSTHICKEQNGYPLQSSKLQVKGWIYRDLSTCLLVSSHLVIWNWLGCYSAKLYVLGLVWAVSFPSVVFQCRLQKLVSPVASQCGAFSTKFRQWHSSVELFQLSFSSGVPVYPASLRRVAQWYPSVQWVNQWYSGVHRTNECTLAQGKGPFVYNRYGESCLS